jgi:hypothetical protein
MNKNFQFLIFNFLILSSLLLPTSSLAVILYLEPNSGQYYFGDTFLVDIKIDTQGKCINVVDIGLNFPNDILKANFSKGDSILILWIEPPLIDQELGLISFSGGIPGGYCGILPGDLREHSYLGRIAFRVHETTQIGTQINTNVRFLEGSQVLLNDGFGTRAELVTRGAVFTLLPEKREVPKDEWKEEIEKDIIPPEPFEIEIGQNPLIFDGKYFISFFTTDKQTGIDYFEVQEGWRRWKRAESPYLLEDQTLQSIIKVRAVDMAGNERIVEHPPLRPREPFPWWIVILVVVGVGVIWLIIKKSKKAKSKN